VHTERGESQVANTCSNDAHTCDVVTRCAPGVLMHSSLASAHVIATGTCLMHELMPSTPFVSNHAVQVASGHGGAAVAPNPVGHGLDVVHDVQPPMEVLPGSEYGLADGQGVHAVVPPRL
jgi:hypothetical protein